MNPLLFAAGLIAVAFGLLFAFQGLGVVRWPQESFMVGAPEWIFYGGAIALGGLVLIIFARR